MLYYVINTISLRNYNTQTLRHVFSSEISTNLTQRVIELQAMNIFIKSANPLIDLLLFYHLTNTPMNRVKYFLSKAQRQFQTTILQHTKLQLTVRGRRA